MITELRETIKMMKSEDYKDRFYAEYWQTKIRYEKLHKMTISYEAGTLDFKPDCPLALLKEQKEAMGKYLHAMEVRAEIEGIDLFKKRKRQTKKEDVGGENMSE